MKKPVCFFVHRDSGAGMENRFDTVSIPNGGIAVLSQIAHNLGIESKAFDEAFLGNCGKDKLKAHQQLETLLFAEIERALLAGKQPIVLCTVLNYNADKSLQLLHCIRRHFGKRVRTGVGGQHIRTCPAAFQSKLVTETGGYLDHIAIGDGEVLLPRILQDEKYLMEGYLELGGRTHYAQPRYDDYHAIRERLQEMANMNLGPFKAGSRQLVIESVRGCAWAFNQKRACSMCALEKIERTPAFKPFDDHFAQIRSLVDKFGINWLFDVSNQWLPVLQSKAAIAWLKSYIEAKKASGIPPINLYTYLTSNSLNASTIPLFREAGIQTAYVGIDGWEKETQAALNKPRLMLRGQRRGLHMLGSQTTPENERSIETMLGLCRENGLFIRTSLVVGSGLNRENVEALPEFVRTLTRNFGDVVLTLGIFEQIILPGSPVFRSFEEDAHKYRWAEVEDLYRLFYQQGYLSWEQQVLLNQHYITYDQRRRVQSGELEPANAVTFEQVEDAIRRARAEVIADGRVVVTSIEDGGTKGGYPEKESKTVSSISSVA